MSCTRTRGKKGDQHIDPADPPRRRANKVRGHGTYATDRPPIFSLIGRTTGEVRYFVREHSDGATCREVLKSSIPVGAATLYTDEWGGYRAVEEKLKLAHGRVKHGIKEWARDDDGDGVREVHCNTCEGAGTGLRSYLRAFRGVHKYHLAEYVATYETMLNAKRITPAVVQRMCLAPDPLHSGCT
jgi:transposase-like protein